MEIWKDIPGFEDKYQVSSFGRISSKTRVVVRKYRSGKKDSIELLAQIIKPVKTSNGYLHFTATRGQQLKVHRAVIAAFRGLSDLEVNHIDGDKQNNHISNLEYCTRGENIRHGIALGLYDNRPDVSGEKNGASKLSKKDIHKIKLLLAKKVRQKDIAKMFCVSQSNISMIKNGKTWAS